MNCIGPSAWVYTASPSRAAPFAGRGDVLVAVAVERRPDDLAAWTCRRGAGRRRRIGRGRTPRGRSRPAATTDAAGGIDAGHARRRDAVGVQGHVGMPLAARPLMTCLFAGAGLPSALGVRRPGRYRSAEPRRAGSARVLAEWPSARGRCGRAPAAAGRHRTPSGSRSRRSEPAAAAANCGGANTARPLQRWRSSRLAAGAGVTAVSAAGSGATPPRAAARPSGVARLWAAVGTRSPLAVVRSGLSWSVMATPSRPSTPGRSTTGARSDISQVVIRLTTAPRAARDVRTTRDGATRYEPPAGDADQTHLEPSTATSRPSERGAIAPRSTRVKLRRRGGAR